MTSSPEWIILKPQQVKQHKGERNMERNPHIKYLELYFREHRKAWENCTDDRGIFCRIYDNLIEAFEIADKLDNTFIHCAVNEYSKKDVARLHEIAGYFTGKTERGGHFYYPDRDKAEKVTTPHNYTP